MHAAEGVDEPQQVTVTLNLYTCVSVCGGGLNSAAVCVQPRRSPSLRSQNESVSNETSAAKGVEGVARECEGQRGRRLSGGERYGQESEGMSGCRDGETMM